MSLFDTSVPLVSFALTQEPAFRDPFKVYIIDAITARIKPREGYTVQDAILTLLADLHNDSQPDWQIAQAKPWLEGMEHPVATFLPGAFSVSIAERPALVPPGTIPVVLKNEDELNIGTARFNRATFSFATYKANAEATHTRLGGFAQESPRGFALAIGAINRALERHSAVDIERLVGPIMAYTVLLTSLYKPYGGSYTGREARSVGLRMGENIVDTLTQGWALRGNTAVSPSHLVDTPAFRTQRDFYQDSPFFAAGAAAVDAIYDGPYGGRKLAGLFPDPTSGHGKLSLGAAQKHLEKALLSHIPMDALKPMAAKRKSRLAA